MSVGPREIGEAARFSLSPPNCPQFIFGQGQGAKLRNRQVSTTMLMPARPVERIKHELDAAVVAIAECVVQDDRKKL